MEKMFRSIKALMILTSIWR